MNTRIRCECRHCGKQLDRDWGKFWATGQKNVRLAFEAVGVMKHKEPFTWGEFATLQKKDRSV